MPQQLERIEGSIQDAMDQFPPPVNLLPINAVFSKLHFRDGQTGRATIHFDLSCDENEVVPNPVRLIIKTPERDVFNRGVILYHLCSDKYPGRNMKQTQPIILTEKQFAQLENNPHAEIVLSSGARESIFQIYF